MDSTQSWITAAQNYQSWAVFGLAEIISNLRTKTIPTDPNISFTSYREET